MRSSLRSAGKWLRIWRGGKLNTRQKGAKKRPPETNCRHVMLILRAVMILAEQIDQILKNFTQATFAHANTPPHDKLCLRPAQSLQAGKLKSCKTLSQELNLQAELARLKREMAEREEQRQAKLLQERVASSLKAGQSVAQASQMSEQLRRTVKVCPSTFPAQFYWDRSVGIVVYCIGMVNHCAGIEHQA